MESANDGMRKPVFIVAVAIWMVIVTAESSSSGWLKVIASFSQAAKSQARADVMKDTLNDPGMRLQEADKKKIADAAKAQSPSASCYGIQMLAVIDCILAYELLLMCISAFDEGFLDKIYTRILSPGVIDKCKRAKMLIQAIITLILSLFGLIGVIILIIAGLIKLLIMVSLFMAVPFGTIAYMIIWGNFDRSGAAATLGAIMTVKLTFAVCLIVAQQRFLQNKGLVILLLVSLLATFITSFLQALVPSVLDNITDSIAGLISLILGAIWLILLVIGAAIAIVRALLSILGKVRTTASSDA